MYSLLFFLLISASVSQDISFPLSVQDDPSEDAEYIQPQHGVPEMSDYQSGSVGLGAGIDGRPSAGVGDVPTAVAGTMDLGISVHRIVRNQGVQQWWVYSPTSIASALYMVLLGANGNTYRELSHLLGINSLSVSLKPHEEFTSILRKVEDTGHEKNVVKIANGLFVQNDFSIRQDYREIIRSMYQTNLQSLDFRGNPSHAREVINFWVANKTLGKIKEILSENPSPETKIVLTSSLYFKGDWANPFPTELTKLQNFYPNGRSQPSKQKVPMMATQGSYRYYHDKLLNCEIVAIPYKGENISFYLILPHNSNKEKLKTLENQLTHSEFLRLSDNTVLTSEIIIAMPKMKLSSDYLLNSALQELGLRSLFDPKEADLSLLATASGPLEEEDRFVFTRMKKLNSTDAQRRKRQLKQVHDLPPMGKSENSLEPRQLRTLANPGLYVNQVIHKVVVDINEQGTEAAATTAVSMVKTVSHTIKADVPFMFFIRHEATKMVLFWGSVVAPPAGNQ